MKDPIRDAGHNEFGVFSNEPHPHPYKPVWSQSLRIGTNGVMKIHMSANIPSMDSGNITTETFRQLLGNQLARVIAINVICLAFFMAFCTVMTLGSPTLLLTYWNEHRAASVGAIMISIVAIPGLVELALSRWRFWQV